MSLTLKITNAGFALLAQTNTLGPIVLQEIAIGSGTWSTPPTGSETALKTLIKKISLTGDTPVNGYIHLTAKDESTDSYTVYEVGLYTSTNVLFALGGSTTSFVTKANVSSALIALDLYVANQTSGSITVGNTNFLFTQATETVAGIAEIATQAEVTTGTDDLTIVTPKKLANANLLSKSGGTISGNLNVVGNIQKNGTNIYNLYSITHTRIFDLIGYIGLNNSVIGLPTTDWQVNGGFTHLTDTITVPAGESWEVQWDAEVGIVSDDILNVGYTKNSVTIFNLINQRYYSNGLVPLKEFLPSGTYVFKFKTLITQQGGSDSIYWGGSGCYRTIRKYKI